MAEAQALLTRSLSLERDGGPPANLALTSTYLGWLAMFSRELRAQ